MLDAPRAYVKSIPRVTICVDGYLLGLGKRGRVSQKVPLEVPFNSAELTRSMTYVYLVSTI